ncbi:hypothetical protein H2202_011223 [Exophiala xenobiotica]|nr:hypothetical protein H2202_011223 [Exophiala xenobiotica]
MARSKPNGYIYSGNLKPLALTAEADGAAARDLLNRALLDDTFDNAYLWAEGNDRTRSSAFQSTIFTIELELKSFVLVDE